MDEFFGNESKYMQAVRRALIDMSSFRRDPDYSAIVETVSPEQGQACLDLVPNKWKFNDPENIGLAKFHICDRIGDPEMAYYPKAGCVDPTFAPTTLRYIKIASDLERLFGNLDGMNVAEIGVGYGGQILVMDQIWDCQYTMFDLPEVKQLASRYLIANDVSNFETENTEFDLVISNYALSELTKELQWEYANNVLAKSKRGYLLLNNLGGFHIGELLHFVARLVPAQIVLVEEQPKTGAQNFLVYWG